MLQTIYALNKEMFGISKYIKYHKGIQYLREKIYRTRAIKSRGLYIFYPISKDHFFVLKEVFSEYSVLMYGLYLRAASNQEQLTMARVRYVYFFSLSFSPLEY